MSINPNNQQINVFSKGMNTDTSDAFIDSEQYRYAENLRFVTNTGSDAGELKSIKGKLPLNIQPIQDTYPLQQDNILAVSKIRDKIIVIGETDDGWCIWSLFEQNADENFWHSFCHFGPCEEQIGDDISIVTRYESDKNIKVYIADGIHKLMSVNIADYAYAGSHIKDITGRLELPLPKLTTQINNNVDSRIQAPVLQYAYILYKLGGATTNISPLTNPIVLYKDNQGYYDGEVVKNTVTLSLNFQNIDTNINRIKVFRIGYVQNGQPPEVALIYDGDFPNGANNSFEFTDEGYNVSKLSTAEFIAQNGIDFKPLVIESKNVYLFAANIEYEQSEVDQIFENCTATYQFELADTYDIDKDNHVSNGTYTASFRRGEAYRFGIVFFDNKGRKSSVMCIDDKSVDRESQQDTSFTTNNNGQTYTAHPYRVKATISNIPAECSGYELVRCKRGIVDSNCITQGIIGRAMQLDDDLAGYTTRYVSPYMTISDYDVLTVTRNGKNMKSCSDCLMFASPEYVYQADDIKTILNQYKNTIELNTQLEYAVPMTRLSDLSNPDGSYYIVYNVDGDVTGTSELEESKQYILGEFNITGERSREGSIFVFDYARLQKFSTGTYWFENQDGKLTTSLSARLVYAGTNDILPFHVWGVNANEGHNKDYYIYMSKIYPISTPLYKPNPISINREGIQYITSPDPHSFDNNGTISIEDTRVPVGDLEFVNWEAPSFYDETGQFESTGIASTDTLYDSNSWYAYGITAGKKCILMNSINFGVTTDPTSVGDDLYLNYPFSIFVANITNTNVIPYGGTSTAAKNNSVFYSFGDYKEHNGGSSDIIYSNNGDCYLSMFVYNSAHSWESAKYRACMYPTVYIVPLESSIDLRAAYGDLYTNMTSQYKYRFQDEAGIVGKLVQERNAYLYNTVYNSPMTIVSYSPIEYTQVSNDKFDCRVHCSQVKTNGEYVDNWLKFKSADFIDVDTRYGEITDMNLFKDHLVFWQNHATGVLAVNERTLLQDVNDTNIILGNGDVLQRYDYITTQYGMKPTHKSKTQSNDVLYWWDGYKRDMLAYTGGQQITPLKNIKTVSTYIDQKNDLQNPNLIYDSVHREVLMNVVEGGPLVYSELINQFTSIYTIPFDYSVAVLGNTYVYSEDSFYKLNAAAYNLKPKLKYVVNKNNMYTKTFDNTSFGLGEEFYTFYDTKDELDPYIQDRVQTDAKIDNKQKLQFIFNTPGGQYSRINPVVTDREYDFRFAIPRDESATGKETVWGGRMRGKTMRCEVTSLGDYSKFSLQYIITKFRISWS